MARIQIAVAKISQKSTEAGDSAHDEDPPGPRFTLSQRKLHQPKIEPAHGDQRAAERDPVVEHKMDDAALVDAAELLLIHAEKANVMRQEMPRRRQEQRE